MKAIILNFYFLKPFLRFLLFMVALSAPAVSSAEQLHAEWYVCQNDSDCVLVPHSSCHGQTSVNRSYLPDYKKFTDDFERVAECAAPQPDDPNAIAKCQKNMCTLAQNQKDACQITHPCEQAPDKMACYRDKADWVFTGKVEAKNQMITWSSTKQPDGTDKPFTQRTQFIDVEHIDKHSAKSIRQIKTGDKVLMHDDSVGLENKYYTHCSLDTLLNGASRVRFYSAGEPENYIYFELIGK